MEDFIPFELAVKLKEKGFDWETREVYERNILACRYEEYPKPTISQVLKWLREEKAFHIDVGVYEWGWYSDVWFYEYVEDVKEYYIKHAWQTLDYTSYEQAATAGIEYVLDNLI